jgi:hypothetical protein
VTDAGILLCRVLADDHHITVIELQTGEVLSQHLIEPAQTYWRNEMREPADGRAPRTETHVATQV